MSDYHDPRIDALFQAARSLPVDERFSESIERAVERRQRRILLGRVIILLAIVAFEIVLNLPIQSSLGVVAELLNTQLVATGGGWFVTLLAPLNTVAGLVGLVLLVLNFLYRRFVH